MSSKAPEKCQFDPERLVLRLNMTVPGDKRAVTPVVERIVKIAKDMGCADGHESAIALAVQEALANAVIHGCGEDPDCSVQITVGCDEDRGILIMIRDPGSGFDPAEVPDPLEGENVFRSHGRGIYLINQLMDEVRYQKGGTEIWMWKK